MHRDEASQLRGTTQIPVNIPALFRDNGPTGASLFEKDTQLRSEMPSEIRAKTAFSLRLSFSGCSVRSCGCFITAFNI